MGADDNLGFVYKAERFCLHDGPGIRTLFYFRGCPLHCRWCCNPESWSQNRQSGADKLLTWTEPVTAETLVELAYRDLLYYRFSDGGVTLTGGEALAQPEFAANLLEKLQRRGIHTALETSGCVSEKNLALALPHLDMALLDIKHMDSQRHQELTGCGNELILANACAIHDQGKPLIIRAPLVPGYNDSEENLLALGNFLQRSLPKVETLCLLGYHNYALNKYRSMGLDYPLGDLPPASDAQMRSAAELLKPFVPEVRIGG